MRLTATPVRRFLTSKHISDFRKNGYAVFKNYIDGEQCRQARTRIDEIIKEQIAIEPKPNIFQDDFDITGALVESADKIRLFYEPKAIIDGKFLYSREQSVNKVGHNLHTLEPIFQSITFNEKTREMLRGLGYEQPVVPQSMAILKPQKIGG